MGRSGRSSATVAGRFCLIFSILICRPPTRESKLCARPHESYASESTGRHRRRLTHRLELRLGVLAREVFEGDATAGHDFGDAEGSLVARATGHEFGAEGDVHAGARPAVCAAAVVFGVD